MLGKGLQGKKQIAKVGSKGKGFRNARRFARGTGIPRADLLQGRSFAEERLGLPGAVRGVLGGLCCSPPGLLGGHGPACGDSTSACRSPELGQTWRDMVFTPCQGVCQELSQP